MKFDPVVVLIRRFEGLPTPLIVGELPAAFAAVGVGPKCEDISIPSYITSSFRILFLIAIWEGSPAHPFASVEKGSGPKSNERGCFRYYMTSMTSSFRIQHLVVFGMVAHPLAFAAISWGPKSAELFLSVAQTVFWIP